MCYLVLGMCIALEGQADALAQVRAKARIIANVELVQIPIVVFDDKGAVATNLDKGDFRILEDGVEQRILSCERERQAVSFVILADVSSSMTKKIPFVQEAALSLLDPDQKADRYSDEFSVFSIETRARRLISFTHDQTDLERRLPLLLTATNGSTALFDGIYFGVNVAQKEAANVQRAVIIISDGGDNHSRFNLKEMRRFLEETDVPVFAIMAGPSFELPPILLSQKPKQKPSPGQRRAGVPFPDLPITVPGDDYVGPAERRGPHNLTTLTEVTGGGVFTARHDEDLARIVRTIGLAVRYRYVLAYMPARDPKPRDAQGNLEGGLGLHKIHLELHPKEKFKNYSIPYYKHSYQGMQ